MILEVRESPSSPALLATNKAAWAEIRDESGNLMLMFLFPPGGAAVLVVNKNQDDFLETARNFGVALRRDPKEIL